MNYLPGDLVECIKDRGWIWLAKGNIYRVEQISPSNILFIFVNNGIIPYPKDCFIPHPATRLEKLICGYYE